MRQEPVLLRLVEAVDLVDEQQRPLAIRMSVPGRLEHFPKLGHAGEDRADLDEVQIRLGGEKPGDGGLAHPRRPPEDQRRQRPRIQHHAQAALRPEQMGLPDDLAQRRRAQTIGQRARTRALASGRRRGGVEEISHQADRLAPAAIRHQCILLAIDTK